MPVGAYFKGGLTPTKLHRSEYDRAATRRYWAAKVSWKLILTALLPGKAKNVISVTVFTLDPLTHARIESRGYELL